MTVSTKAVFKSVLRNAAWLCVAPSLLSQIKSESVLPKSVSVPFVGCKADGQVGPLDAPRGTTKVVSISPEAAQKLAYYKAEQGGGVLAPRGWYCFETYGSNGSNLYISPTPIDSENVFSDKWEGMTGPAIQFTTEIGDTSGRFGVAKIIARVFPAHKAFVRDVIAEGIEPASSFPFGPYPNDKLTYKNSETVEYTTPAQTDGLGTHSRLKKNTDPISGVAILTGPDTNLLLLSVRLPPAQANLILAIIQQTEHEVILSSN
jgi:hypothetical protein